MKFFIDTADVAEIRKAQAYGLVDGVTTNPTLIAKSGRPFAKVAREILDLVPGPVSLEATSLEAEGLIREGRGLAKLGENVVVKIPLTLEGLKATRVLAQDGIKTNVTLCFSPTQALLAAKAQATYVSPFVGRLDDISEPGMELIAKILTIYKNYGFKTEVIVASVRNPLHVVDAALLGASIATIPYSVIEQLVKHPLTDLGIERFMKDWTKVEK